MSVEEIEQELEKVKALQECPDEFKNEIASTLYRYVTTKHIILITNNKYMEYTM